MNAHLNRLYAYHDWANRQYFPILGLEAVPAECIRLYSHILNAHGIWMARILNQKVPVAAFDIHKVENFPQIHEGFQAQSVRLLEIERNLDRVINYSNSSGERFSNSLGDIMAHIVNHGTYHRGQVAMLLRKADIAPVQTDYIFYQREQGNL
ncbi:MAG: DinB family protein [Bacteroidota bacterium]